MDELTILRRARIQTLNLIEQTKKINERTIREHGRENGLSLYWLQKFGDEERYLHDKIVELENKGWLYQVTEKGESGRTHPCSGRKTKTEAKAGGK